MIINIKIDIVKFATAVDEITAKWNDTKEHDPILDKLLLYQTAAVKIGIPKRDAELTTLADFVYAKDAPTTPWLGKGAHEPEDISYVGGHGTQDENHDPNSDQTDGGYNKDGDILINTPPATFTISLDLGEHQAKEYAEAAKKELELNPEWKQRQGAWRENYKGHDVLSYVVRYVQDKAPDLITHSDTTKDEGVFWPITNKKKDETTERVGVLKSTDPRAVALPEFLKFANVNLKEISPTHASLQLPPAPLEAFGLTAASTLEDKFARYAADNAQFARVDQYFDVNQGPADLRRINIDASIFEGLNEAKKTGDDSKLKPIRFYGAGLAGGQDSLVKADPVGAGLQEHMEILASILEAYSKIIKDSRREVPVDLEIQAENLRKIPLQIHQVLKANNLSLTSDYSDKYEIKVNTETFKVESFNVQKPGGSPVDLRYGVDTLKTSGPLSSPATVHFFFHAAEILTDIKNSAMVDSHPWTEFLTTYYFPVPSIGPEVGGPVTDLLEDMILGGTGDMLNDTFVVEGTQNGKVSPKLLANIEAAAQGAYHEIGEKIFGGKILSANMEKIVSLEDFFKQILHKVSISELITIAFKCLAKYTDIADYLDAACDWAIENLGLKKVETKLLPMIKKKDAKTGAFLEKKINEFKAKAISIVQKEGSKFIADNAVTEFVEDADQKYFMKNENSKDVAAALNKGLGDMLKGMKSDVGLCAALLLLIPAVFQLFKEDIDEEKLWKAAKKRWKVFIMDDFPITDFLSEIGKMILQILLNILRDVLLALVSKILVQVDKHCSESAEGDLLGANPDEDPYNLQNINDLIRDGTTPEKFDKTLQLLFLDLGSTVNISKTIDFTDFLDDLSKRLTISQLCAVMSGAMPRDVFLLIETLIKERYPSLISFLDDGTTIEKIFKAIGSIIDPAACNKAVEEYEKAKEMSASCCFDLSPLAAKEKILNEKIGPEKANHLESISRQDAERKGGGD